MEGTEQITLTSRGLYCEQLRHLLTVHNGRIPQNFLLTIYLSEFRHPQNYELLSWLHKKPIRYANHVVHLAAEFYVIWAPTGHPYPDTRAEKQSRILPEDRSVTVNELGTVPAVLASVISEPLPPTAITLDICDSHDLLCNIGMPALIDDTPPVLPVTNTHNDDTPVLPVTNTHNDDTPVVPVTNTHDDDTPVVPVTITHNDDVMTLPDLVTLDSIQPASQDDRSTTTTMATGGSSSLSLTDNDVVTGLDHGEFAGMTHETVLERMQLEMRNGTDSRTKLQRMGDFINYFGELSGIELERVNGPPVPKPRKSKTKSSRLAIQFPGPASSFDSNNSDERDDRSPKTSPILGERQRNGGKLDCLSQSDSTGILNQGIIDWDQQLVDPTSGAYDTYSKDRRM